MITLSKWAVKEGIFGERTQKKPAAARWFIEVNSRY